MCKFFFGGFAVMHTCVFVCLFVGACVLVCVFCVLCVCNSWSLSSPLSLSFL